MWGLDALDSDWLPHLSRQLMAIAAVAEILLERALPGRLGDAWDAWDAWDARVLWLHPCSTRCWRLAAGLGALTAAPGLGSDPSSCWARYGPKDVGFGGQAPLMTGNTSGRFTAFDYTGSFAALNQHILAEWTGFDSNGSITRGCPSFYAEAMVGALQLDVVKQSLAKAQHTSDGTQKTLDGTQ